MNKRLYRKCRLYRLFFIGELRDREYHRAMMRIRRIKRKVAECMVKQFESDIERKSYGEALVTACLYFMISDDFSYGNDNQ